MVKKFSATTKLQGYWVDEPSIGYERSQKLIKKSPSYQMSKIYFSSTPQVKTPSLLQRIWSWIKR